MNVSQLHELIAKRYSEHDAIDDAKLFNHLLEMLSNLDKSECIWCKYPRMSAELLRLFSFPPNECSKWFREKCIGNLSKCPECLEGYYEGRWRLTLDMRQIFSQETIGHFWENISTFDAERLLQPLNEFQLDKIDSKNIALLLALYEILLFPRHLLSQQVRASFRRVLKILLDRKKMIKFSSVLPGLFVCLFDGESFVSEWAASVLSVGDLMIPNVFLKYSFDFSLLNEELSDDFEKLSLMVKKFPSSDDGFSDLVGFIWKQSSFHSDYRRKYSLLTMIMSKFDFNLTIFSFITTEILNILCENLEREFEVSWALGLLERHAKNVKGLVMVILNVLRENSFSGSNISELLYHLIAGGFLDYCDSDQIHFITTILCKDQTAHTKIEEIQIVACWKLFLKKENTEIQSRIAKLTKSGKARSCLQKLILDAFKDSSNDSKEKSKDELEKNGFVSEYFDSLEFTKMILKRKSLMSFIFHDYDFNKIRARLLIPSFLILFLKSPSSSSLEECKSKDVLLEHLFKSFPEACIEAINDLSMVATAIPLHSLAKGLLHFCTAIIRKSFFISDDKSKTIIDAHTSKEKEKLQVNLWGNILLFVLSCTDQFGFSSFYGDSIFKILRFLKALSQSGQLFERKELILLIQNNFVIKGESLATFTTSLLTYFQSTIDKFEAHFFSGSIAYLISLFNKLAINIDGKLDEALFVFYTHLNFSDFKSLQYLSSAITDYERNMRQKLKYPASLKDSMQINSCSIENKALKTLKDQKGGTFSSASSNTGGPSHQHTIRLQNLNQSDTNKPSSKLGQLRAELKRDNNIPAFKATKRTLPTTNLSNVVKAPSMDIFASSSSSDSEGEERATDLPKVQVLSKQRKLTEDGEDAPSRSIKLINLPSAGRQLLPSSSAALSLLPSGKAAKYIKSSSEWIKSFHERILNLNLDDIEIMDGQNQEIRAIPERFSNSSEYIAAFEPLLYMECKAQIVQSLADVEESEWREVVISKVSFIDKLHEINVFSADGRSSRASNGLSDHEYIHLNFGNVKLPAIVVSSSIIRGVLETCLRLQVPAHLAHIQIQFRQDVKILYRKVSNLITSVREFISLHSITTLRLAPAILSPSPQNTSSQKDVVFDFDPSSLCSTMDINESQARAILSVAESSSPFSLIQGPPGTGKTKTIESLLGFLFGHQQNRSSQRVGKRRVIVCAPSNAAIDEIVRRIRHGLVDLHGEQFEVKVLRVGSLEMMSSDVVDLTIDRKVEERLSSSLTSSNKLLEEQREACEALKAKLYAAERSPSPNPNSIKKLKTDLWDAKENLRKNAKFIEDSKSSIKKKVLEDIDIVCCTLSSSGHDLISSVDFEYAIIDEACQAVELSCLVPLQHNVRKCVLIGDPNQLPPTVISQMATVYSYEQSLFVRLQRASPSSILLLNTQYRMHPEISKFPNNYFYQGSLVDGPQMHEINRRPWHSNPLLGPFRFFEVRGSEGSESHKSTSRLNEMEAIVAANLIATLCKENPEINMFGKIGIVTPYKDQRRTLRRVIGSRFGSAIAHSLEISTVDSFQGQEKEIIIFSCVRTGESRGLGFLNDTRRLNVALTRAKCSLFVLGKSESLLKNPIWGALIEDAKARDCFVMHDIRRWDGIMGVRSLPNLMPPAPRPSPILSKNAISPKSSNRSNKIVKQRKKPSVIQTPTQRAQNKFS